MTTWNDVQKEKPDQLGALFKRGHDFQKLRRQVREKGALGSAKFLLQRVPARLKWWAYYRYHRRHDRSFDREFGVDTCGVKLPALVSNSFRFGGASGGFTCTRQTCPLESQTCTRQT